MTFSLDRAVGGSVCVSNDAGRKVVLVVEDPEGGKGTRVSYELGEGLCRREVSV